MAVGPIPSAAEDVEVRTRTPVKALRRSTAELAESPGDGKVDRRVRKTKSQLRQALTTLLLKKSFSEITVREISELADVNRGTFYTHYRDTADLLYQLENAFLDKLRDINVTVIRQDWEEATYVYLEEVFVLCYDNADIYTALVRNNGDQDFQARFVSVLRNQFLRNFLENVCRTEAMVSLWLDTGMRETPEQMAKLGGDFIMRGVKGLR